VTTRILTALAVAAFMALGVWGLMPKEPMPLVDVTVPPLSGEAAEGAPLFVRYCSDCHGPAGAGSTSGPPLMDLIYAPGHHSDASFYYAVLHGSRAHHWRFGAMPPVKGVSEQQVGKIIAFVRAVQRANGIE
jgi:mono/diheme cytochrome c family protein